MSAINKTEEAIKVLEDYLESKKNKDRQIQFELVSLYLSIGNLNSAEKLIDDILEIDSTNIELIFKVGRLYYNSKAFDLAEKHFSYLLSMNLMSNDVNYYLGMIDYNKGSYVESIRHFDRVTGGDLKFAAQLRKASSIAKEKNVSDAIEFLENLQSQYVSSLVKVNILLAEIQLYNEEKQYMNVVDLVNHSIPKYQNNLRLIY